MCRNIRVLFNFEPPATDEEIHAAALQYVRKVSGAAKPAQANQEAFDDATSNAGLTGDISLNTMEWEYAPWMREFRRAVQQR